jgi:thiol:disulfide interchange protein DsbC
MRNFLFILLAAASVAPAGAAEGEAAGIEAARTALATLAPGARIDGLRAAPLPGFFEASLGGQPVVVSADGRYLVAGALWDVKARRNLSDALLSAVRREALDELPHERRIVFAAAQPRRTVTVFTALDCGYCRKLHEQIADINAQGISVEYLLLPRGGLDSPSFDAAVSVWCAVDRSDALTEAKRGHEPPPKTCPNPIAEHAALAQRLGVSTTPTVVAPDGQVIGGYLTTEQLAGALGLGGAAAR